MEIGQGELAAVRQMAAHQQMMAEMRMRPVRRIEIAHHIIGKILLAEIEAVHRLPVVVMTELQKPVRAVLHQPVQAVRRFLLNLCLQAHRRGERLPAKSDIGNPGFACDLQQ